MSANRHSCVVQESPARISSDVAFALMSLRHMWFSHMVGRIGVPRHDLADWLYFKSTKQIAQNYHALLEDALLVRDGCLLPGILHVWRVDATNRRNHRGWLDYLQCLSPLLSGAEIVRLIPPGKSTWRSPWCRWHAIFSTHGAIVLIQEAPIGFFTRAFPKQPIAGVEWMGGGDQLVLTVDEGLWARLNALRIDPYDMELFRDLCLVVARSRKSSMTWQKDMV